jgi:hypothetical protein
MANPIILSDNLNNPREKILVDVDQLASVSFQMYDGTMTDGNTSQDSFAEFTFNFKNGFEQQFEIDVDAKMADYILKYLYRMMNGERDVSTGEL